MLGVGKSACLIIKQVSQLVEIEIVACQFVFLHACLTIVDSGNLIVMYACMCVRYV